ncbi:hypothetical protein AX17_004079 [Amanita inopinata Kibby_2008]|nr:hypothetical protein AX17_004079 [Amanita inopinata Kibby_2008]
MSEGIQITIPDFDDEEYSSAPTPFGRSTGHGFGSPAFGSALDSPVPSTPFGSHERTHFPSHSRGDSAASVDSTGSGFTRVTSKSTPFAHSSQSSITTTSTSPFSKKPSFASIRNAFKSGKLTDAPPLPQLDNQAYPILKNPFNRSTSSLNHSTATNSRSATLSAFPRPPTPTTKLKSKNHVYAKSHHSQTGSIYHISDGSDHGHPFLTSSPPPVPRVPNGFGHMPRSETPPPIFDLEEDKVVIDPKSPSDFALHAVFIRFADLAEKKIDAFLRLPLDQEVPLAKSMAAGIDTKFDDILRSLGKIAQKHTKPVIDSIMRWRRSQNENVGSDIIRVHTTRSPSLNRSIRMHDIPGLLNERKSLASIYIMSRALIAVLQSLPKDALSDIMGHNLEGTTFDQFRRPELKLLQQSANHRANAELYAVLLGHISNFRFMSVTDRFLAELTPLASGQVPKDFDMRYENLLKGLKHIQIKVWPPEAFEEGAEFLESLSKSFANAHGQRLKIAFAETLSQLLHPIGKTAQAETNNPQWAKAIEVIYPKAREMMSKPRYWHAAFPLVIISLCVAPQTFFLKNWNSCFEASFSKLKEKALRATVMNGIIRLFWTYLYRCPESASTTTTKLDTLLKHFFPSTKLTVYPQEDRLDSFIHIVHFILSRHVDYGQEFCLELIQEPSISSQPSNVAHYLTPERTAIIVQAILLSLHAIEKENGTPAWPSGCDFTTPPPSDDYPTSSEYLAPALVSKFGVPSYVDRLMAALGTMALHCAKVVGSMSVIDEQWSYPRSVTSYEESHNIVTRKHMDGTVVGYPGMYVAHISLLRICFESWPRLYHSSIALPDAVDILLRAVVHVEPTLSEAASDALKRFMADYSNGLAILGQFNHFLFSAARISQDSLGARLLVELPQLLYLWLSVIDNWVKSLTQRSKESILEDEQALSCCREIESGALFLMMHESWSIHSVGVKVIRILGLLVEHLGPNAEIDNTFTNGLHLVECFHGKHNDRSYLNGFEELLDSSELARLEQWRQSKWVDIPLRIADSSNEKDRKLWRCIFPLLMQSAMNTYSQSLLTVRESLIAAVSRYHPTISVLAGLSSKVPPNLSTRSASSSDGLRLLREQKPLVDQWHVWVKVLCATAVISEPLRPGPLNREHAHVPSDTAFERERLSTTRGLFRYLTPFLDSEYTPFRDAAVLCISSFPPNAYPQLLEDLGLLASRQFYDDPRAKIPVISGVELNTNINILANRQVHDESKAKSTSQSIDRSRRQERLHSAVARIYYLTAHLLQQQRATGRQAALANVLKFVRNTQAFLTTPDMRDNHTLQRLRRYFCGTVERLFDGLATLKDSDRFIPLNMHLTLYRLCEEWCQLGPQSESARQRFIFMQRAAASGSQGSSSEAAERFRRESTMLSQAAIGALASLCQKAFFPPDLSSSSPTDHPPAEFLSPLSAAAVLDRLAAILSSSHTASLDGGKKALHSILVCNPSHSELINEALRRSIILSDQPESSGNHFFQVISDIVCKQEDHGFSFAQVVCLGLSNLCNPSPDIRRRAFKMLEAMHVKSSGLLSMFNFEPYVCSLASSTYLHAHRLISDFLAGEHPDQAHHMLVRIALWLPQLPEDGASKTNVVLLLLQSLEFWIPNIELMMDDSQRPSQEAVIALYHLISLTLRHGQTHCEQILTIWARLVDPPRQSNGHAAIQFLTEQSHKVGSTVFISCAANIIACLCQTHIGREIFDDLCSMIEPTRMLPVVENRLTFLATDDVALWSELDALFSEQPRLQLGPAQFAWLFLTDVALQRPWEIKSHLPTLLHALVIHLDHRNSYVRTRAQRMLFQLIRSWLPGYDELPDRSVSLVQSPARDNLHQLELEAESHYWKEDEPEAELEPKLKWLCSHVVDLLEPLYPSLTEWWGSLALNWGTSCSIRQTAFRSLQIFRALSPQVKQADLALLLGRLSNTIAASVKENIQPFNCEMIRTITAIVTMDDLDRSLLPQLFWSACACLSTTVQSEFHEALHLLDSLLTRFNLESNTADSLISHQPKTWSGVSYLQPLLFQGLRSSVTTESTFNVLCTLTKTEDDRLVDPTSGRVRDLYTLVLPWCLHAMASEKQDETLKDFAQNISQLAAHEGRQSIQKIMTSFAKNHFRTKDDFLRQSVASLREHYGSDCWTEVVTLLLGLVLNQERWLQVHTMQILKLLFQQKETRNPFELMGSQLLMPLLRLLETDLATQALDVLEEPMALSNSGPAAKHVLRMSMHIQSPQKSDPDLVSTVFGVPEESGWCIAQIENQRERCRANVGAVFDTCSMPTRPSRIDFEPEIEALAEMEPVEDDLGGLVKDLHDLTSFFQEEPSFMKRTPATPDRRLEARVAAILAKSTGAAAIMDIPQTPFLDVFRVGGASAFEEESDEDSDVDSEVDAFIFDSPNLLSPSLNGTRFR